MVSMALFELCRMIRKTENEELGRSEKLTVSDYSLSKPFAGKKKRGGFVIKGYK